MTMNSLETASGDQPNELLNSSNKVVTQTSCKSRQIDDVICKPNTISRTNCANLQNDAVVLNTIQNIYDPNSDYNKNKVNNRTTYLKLHRHSFSPGSNVSFQKLKEKYETASLRSSVPPNVKIVTDSNNLIKHLDSVIIETAKLNNEKLNQPNIPDSIVKTTLHIANLQSANKLTPDSIDKLREKYSPKSFGYPKTKLVLPSKIPVPTPRNSLTNQITKLEAVKVKEVTVNDKENLKVPIISEVTPNNFEEVQLIYNHIEFAKPEAKHFIVTRSSSEDSVLQVENSLAEFVMDKKPKEKKRSSSFRRILSGGLFGRDKKKQDDDKIKPKKKDNIAFADNAQNESQVFDRYASHRHTVDSTYPRHSLQKTAHHGQNNSGPLYYYKPQQHHLNTSASKNVDNRYTDMKGNVVVNYPQQPNTHEEYVEMDNSRQVTYLNVNKFIDTSSSSSNTDSDIRNCTYQNALIAQAELRHIRENQNSKNGREDSNSDTSASSTASSCNQKTFQKVELVKPKAAIPINSERALPNPYHNIRDNSGPNENMSVKTIEHNFNIDNCKHPPNRRSFYKEQVKSPLNTVMVEDTYGTVFDSISSTKENKFNSPGHISPRSLETSKLKLPPNREKVELQPRIKSPIPQTKVSTDKIIATELLRSKGSPSRSPFGSIERSHKSSPRLINENQGIRLPNAHSAPQTISNEYIHLSSSSAATKPPLSPRDNLRLSEACRKQKESHQVISATVHHDATDRNGFSLQRNPSASPLHMRDNAAYSPNNAGAYQKQSGSSSILLMQTNSLDRNSDLTQNQKHNVNQFHEGTSNDLYKTRVVYSEQQSPSYNYTQTVASPDTHNRDSLRKWARYSPNNIQFQQYHQPQHHRDSIISDVSYATLNQVQSSQNSTRPHTPVGQNFVAMQPQRSPEKQQMIQNVEAFYWRELKKLKEQEELDLLDYRQQQFYLNGYIDDAGLYRHSRSISPTMQRGRRSLSLPREGQPLPPRIGLEMIVDGHPVIVRRPSVLPTVSNELEYGQIRHNLQRNPNFVRNTFERTTIGPIGTSRYYEKHEQPNHENYTPIFKRGSLTSENSICNDTQFQMSKKVSFSNPSHSHNVTKWPTRNGSTQGLPSRRIERDSTEDVFLPNSPRTPQSKGVEYVYVNDSNEPVSKAPQVSIKSDYQQPASEPLYGSAFTKHVTVSNKECDIYGQIHDSKQPQNRQLVQMTNQNYGQIKQVGYVYGQLHKNPKQRSPVVMDQTFDHLNPTQTNFVRGTRLTASVNDMYHRYPVDTTTRPDFARNTIQPPNRPLPPVPERIDSRSVLTKRLVYGYPQLSDTESGSEAAEVQRILHMGAKQKGFGVGK